MKRSLKAGVAVTATLALVGGGVAYAYYTESAIGTATAPVKATTGNLSVAVAVVGAELTPGGTGQTVTWTATNNSSQTITLTSASIEVRNADGTQWYAAAGCSASDFEFVSSGVSSGPSFTWSLGTVEVVSGGTFTGSSVTFQMINQPYNQNGCKGAAVPLYVNVG